MALTKSGARTKVRTRIRDTVATYEYSDATLDTYLAPALKEIANAVRDVDPDYYLKSKIYRGYLDAVDPAPSGSQGYEFYRLPDDFAAKRWVERADGGLHYRIKDVSAIDQEAYRFNATLGFSQQVSVTDSSVSPATTTNYDLGAIVGRESVSIHGNRMRIVPPPTASGPEYRLWYDAEPLVPVGEAEDLNVPPAFEEALLRAWGIRPLEDDGSPLLGGLDALLRGPGGELALAKRQHAKRVVRGVVLGKCW